MSLLYRILAAALGVGAALLVGELGLRIRSGLGPSRGAGTGIPRPLRTLAETAGAPDVPVVNVADYSREQSLRILEELNAHFFDLLEPLEQAFEEAVPVQAWAGDRWHPNSELAGRMAHHSLDRNLLPCPAEPDP